ncbi:MAG: Gfo/Idh/MocA family oxidoreductase [Bacteroidales bacterium]|nr:Gfo/Idh/MocA family oxidoreductase [Bacteroidales bacterium]MCF8403395.1 Gfo/Idh/MocA family oxidoreductase [Bacteroidales bacterium]
MLKIGVLGAGHLGKIHIKCIQESDKLSLVGFFDPDDKIAETVEKEYSTKRFNNISDLIDSVDIVDIVTPTISHFDCATQALRGFKHVFIEKPVVTTPDEARQLIALAQEAEVKVQVGHVERFNPAFTAALPYFGKPMFIETHRLAQFNPRGTDVPVILDLMIHDLDIVLSVVKSNIRKVHASGVSVVSDTPDIANARLEFDNGCVANLTASRISMKNMRKSRFFQQDAYISVDFLEKKTEIFQMEDVPDPDKADPLAMIINLGEGKGSKKITLQQPEIKPVNAIKTELESFAYAIKNNQSPLVSINDGYAALDLAYKIIEKMKFGTD